MFGALGTGLVLLKNLVLPGVGKYTVVGDQRVAESDPDANFFLHDSCVGRSRAECTTVLLEELELDVKVVLFMICEFQFLKGVFF